MRYFTRQKHGGMTRAALALTVVAAALLTVFLSGQAAAVTVTLNPTVDGEWRRGSQLSQTTAYGHLTTIDVGREKIYSTWTKENGLLQFDLSGLDAECIEGVTLKMMCLGIPPNYGGVAPVHLYYSAGDDWGQNGNNLEGASMTAANTSSFGTATGLPLTQLLSSSNPSVGVVEWDLLGLGWNPGPDVTDGILSLLLKIPSTYESSNVKRVYSFASMENTNSDLWPMLQIEMCEPPSGSGGDPAMMPEPMTMLGLFLGLGGIGTYLRRRRA